MKIRVMTLGLLMAGIFGWNACTKETMDPEEYGNIEGSVQNSETGQGIAFASITTNPGTNAILTDENGMFSINSIPTGNYVVQAEKKDYSSKTVRVQVVKGKSATAQILLANDGGESAGTFINAEVTSFFNNSRNDSSFVDINYLVKNNSNNQPVSKFEVYFKIYTRKTIFYGEIKGDTLNSGQQSVGSFTEYINATMADSVSISGVYAPN